MTRMAWGKLKYRYSSLLHVNVHFTFIIVTATFAVWNNKLRFSYTVVTFLRRFMTRVTWGKSMYRHSSLQITTCKHAIPFHHRRRNQCNLKTAIHLRLYRTTIYDFRTPEKIRPGICHLNQKGSMGDTTSYIQQRPPWIGRERKIASPYLVGKGMLWDCRTRFSEQSFDLENFP